MPADLATMKALLDRVEGGTGADREINWLIAEAFDEVPPHAVRDVGFDYDWFRKPGDFALWKANDSAGCDMSLWEPAKRATSIDAAVALYQREMPGWDVSFYPDDGAYVAEAIWPEGALTPEQAYFPPVGRASTRAGAILAALLKAKIAEASDADA